MFSMRTAEASRRASRAFPDWRSSNRLRLRNYFDVLGVKPVPGRTFSRDEQGDLANGFTAVISHGLWQRYFQGNRSILGHTVRINRRRVTIVGVAPGITDAADSDSIPLGFGTRAASKQWPEAMRQLRKAVDFRSGLDPFHDSAFADMRGMRLPWRRFRIRVKVAQHARNKALCVGCESRLHD